MTWGSMNETFYYEKDIFDFGGGDDGAAAGVCREEG